MTFAPDRVPGGLVSLSHDLRILDVNAGLVSLAGRPAEDLVGKLFDVLLTAPSRILFQTHVYPALTADGRVEEVFLTLAAPDGEPIPVLFNATATTRGADAAYQGLLVRIRARARWEADLLDATRELERERTASRQLADDLAVAAEALQARFAEEQRGRAFRDAFIGVISHELRTPITTIYGMSTLLRRRVPTMEPAAIERELDDVIVEADRLRRLTEDLLVLSRAEGGRLELAEDPVVVRHVVEAAVQSERVRVRDHEFDVALEPSLPLVCGEEIYLEQVVRNFLSNAAKYSPAGTTIRVRAVGEDGGVAVRVTDEGDGLPDGPPEQLFELFHRAPSAVARTAGAGIGLFVCRELVTAMHGRIWAAPAAASDGGGAEFGFWLPAMRGDEG